MSRESYVEELWPILAEEPARAEKIEQVIDLLRRIVRSHAVFLDGVGKPMATESKQWDPLHPNRLARLNFRNAKGGQIEREATAVPDIATLVAYASFQIADGRESMSAFDIQVWPPEIFDHHGQPLRLDGVERAASDLQHYQNLLNGQTAQAPSVLGQP